ncbi:SDR family NAD(P)-dependent oxidoreductase [Wenjunlia tyrosinilytica]|uniref:SDR family NAD(P)-dependent oxidoreductase n=1 Tax=Wenjunlia tyrosinilytica TaxID=1544741 RepID=UPI00166AC4D4|nr:SDR family NAD(P)-dependent oxidoreductase [Wenjunlia tyrosinilytica]
MAYQEPRLSIVSNATGEPATAEELSCPDYWVGHVRRTVRFADGVRQLEGHRVGRFVELGPDGTLTAMAQGCLEGDGHLLVSGLRRDRPELTSLLSSVAAVFTHGGTVDWSALFAGTGARRVALPTYAFQRRRYWLEAAVPTGDPAAVGLDRTGHPLLGAAVTLVDSGSVVFTGRLSTRTHPWLADHAVLGRAILPATAYLDLAVHAGDHVGLGHLAELTLETPLVLPERGAAQLQLTLGAEDETGRRAFTVHSRPTGSDDEPWVRHAQGTLSGEAQAPPPDPGAWPPPGAVRVADEDWYERFAEGGFRYGPAFQGLEAVWRCDREVFAEVALPEPYRADASHFLLHPALLDAAVQTLLVDAAGNAADGAPAEAMLPFAWSGVTLHATGATALRVHLVPADRPDEFSVSVADTSGEPVATADRLLLRRVAPDQVQPARKADTPATLLRLDWQPAGPGACAAQARRWALLGSGDGGVAEALDTAGVHLESYADLDALAAAVDTGMAVPEAVLMVCDPDTHGTVPPPKATRVLLSHLLAVGRRWVTDDRFCDSRLVLVTRGAIAVEPGEDVPDLAAASLWGLVRSAQLEHPGRLQLLDLAHSGADDTRAFEDEADRRRLLDAVVAAHPQAVLRDSGPLVPRLVPVEPGESALSALDPKGTVLVTGATGALGGLVTRHLVAEHGVRHLLLAARRGPEAEGADTLLSELAGQGAEARLVACDVGDRTALEDLMRLIPAEHPLTAVVHIAGVVDDGTFASLRDEQVERVLRPKADAAWLLHRLTAHLGLSAFVLFSSAAGTFGAAGQADYAAANAFLDGLAHHRRALGLPATSLAWGLWEGGGMAAGLSEADHARMARNGMRPLSAAHGLALFDAALTVPDAALAAVAREVRHGGGGSRSRVGARRAAAEGAGSPTSLLARLSGRSAAEQRAVLLDLVRGQVAAVLGHASAQDIDPDQHFAELGFDSLTAVELRNQLNAATGLRLPPTLAFDVDTPDALADHLYEQLASVPPDEEKEHPAPGAAPAGSSEDTLGALFRTACEQGRIDQGFALLQAAAELRPVFESPEESALVPAGVKLAGGDSGASLVCFSSYVALAGVHQYARFASAFRGERDVWALPTPGFGRGEPLPASLDAVARLQADSVLRCADGKPFVLLGSSSGGILALAAARHLEKSGLRPLGVALLDTYMPRADSPFTRFSAQMLGGMFDRESMFAHMDTARLSAMSWYIRMVGEWAPDDLESPVVLVRPREAPVGVEQAGPLAPEDWQSSWDGAQTVAEVPGNHFTMMESHAATTAEAVVAWLGEVLPRHTADHLSEHRPGGA